MNNILTHLRDPIVKRNLSVAGEIKTTTRNFLKNNGFKEYDTPILMPKTGENYNSTFDIMIDGKQASLADSPQIYKLMLFMAGHTEYYQFAHCFRKIENESDKHTRLCEFTQIDIETQVPTLSALIKIASELLDKIFAALKIKPSIQHMDGIFCRDTYGSKMKPDLRRSRNEISVVFIEHMPLTNGEKTMSGKLIPCHHIFALPSNNIQDTLEDTLINTKTESFDIVINGIEIGGGDLRILNKNLQQKMMNIFDVEKEKYTGYLDMLSNYTGRQSGGFAIGLERLVMALFNCNNISQTVCFPDFYKREKY